MKEFFKKYWKEIAIVALLITIVILFTSLRTSNKETQRWEDNYYTAMDSINIISRNNGDLIYERDMYKLNYEELDRETQKIIKNLEKDLKQSINYISKLEGNIQIDTITLIDSVWINDNITHIGFNYNDTWTKISGVTILDNDTITQLNSIYINAPLLVTITDNEAISVTSQNPYIYFSSIEGAHINNTPKSFKHWSLCLEANMDIQYGIFNKTLDVIPNIEANLSYLFKNNIYIKGNIGLDINTSINKTDIFPYAGLGVGYNITF